MKIEFNLSEKSIVLDGDTAPKTEEELLLAQELACRLLVGLFKQGAKSIESPENRSTQIRLEEGIVNILSIKMDEDKHKCEKCNCGNEEGCE